MTGAFCCILAFLCLLNQRKRHIQPENQGRRINTQNNSQDHCSGISTAAQRRTHDKGKQQQKHLV